MNDTQVITSTRTSLAVPSENGGVFVDAKNSRQVTDSVLSFLDSAPTATGRDTFYNTRTEQELTSEAIHEGLMSVNRGLYAAMLTLPGLMDYSMRAGVIRLLSNPEAGVQDSLLTVEQENKALDYLCDRIKTDRMIKMFVGLKESKVNNSRTRKLILRTLLRSSKLSYWSVKYRTKMKTAITHALGVRQASALRGILSKSRKTKDDRDFVLRSIGSHLGISSSDSKDSRFTHACECVCFILGGTMEWKSSDIKAFFSARENLETGSVLPGEVLEGIRSTHHKEVPHAKVIELTKDTTMTERQKMKVQRSASKAGVEVKFNPARQDLVDLYIYALEMGSSDEIRKAMDSKAEDIARALPLKYDKIGILMDTSGSMAGGIETKNRPLAIGLGMRDVLKASAGSKAIVKLTGGRNLKYGLVRPEGGTSFASKLISLVEEKPDVIYMITDGYENSTAGRTSEVIRQLRRLGVSIPIYQVSPVMSAEAGGVRKLADDIQPMPVSKPEGIGLSMVRAAIEGDINYGLEGLMNIARPMLETGHKEG